MAIGLELMPATLTKEYSIKEATTATTTTKTIIKFIIFHLTNRAKKFIDFNRRGGTTRHQITNYIT